MLKRYFITLTGTLLLAFAATSQVTLDSLRHLAIDNNKQLRIAAERIEQAGYEVKQAKAAYLPALDFSGTYLYNQKKLSIFDSDQFLPTLTFDPAAMTYKPNVLIGPDGNPVMNPQTGEPIYNPVAYLPKDHMTYDIHNVFAGAVTLTQPVYMGGKIRAMNQMARYAQALQRDLAAKEADEVIYNVDATYWTVVSLVAKKRLATSYVELLDTLKTNVEAMLREGVATRSDLLSVEVRLNEANVDLMKVENGVALARMALNQLCGLPVNEQYTLADENANSVTEAKVEPQAVNLGDVYARRHDVSALSTAIKVFEQKEKVAFASMLPNVAVVGMYSFSNPNMFNGFQKRFAGAFSVGAMVSIPIWHWGGNYNKWRAAKSQTIARRLELEDVKEKIELQVAQASFRCQEAVKTHEATASNMSKAQENLRTANVGFLEGVLPMSDVMAAQTAWLKANSELIDAAIDVRLCDVYLSKVLGTLGSR